MTLTHALPVRRGIGYIALAAVFWGTGGTAAALLYRTGGIGPVAVSCWRFAVAVVLMAAARPLVRKGTGPRMSLVDTGWTVATGAGMALAQAAYFASVRFAGVAIGTVITIGAGPALITLGARYTLGERLTRRSTAVLVVALLGVALLIVPGTHPRGGRPLLGAGLALLSALGYAAVTLLGRAGDGRGEPYDRALAGFAAGTLLLLPVALLVEGGGGPRGALAVGLLGYLGAVPTALAYCLFFTGLRVVRAGTASVVALLEVLTAALLGVVALHERLSPVAVAGALLLSGSVLLAR